jgi:hypothetical protein
MPPLYPQKALNLSCKVNECKPLPYTAKRQSAGGSASKKSSYVSAAPARRSSVTSPCPSDTAKTANDTARFFFRSANAAKQGLTLFPISAQFELTLPFPAQIRLTLSPIQLKLTRGCVPRCSS